MTISLLLCAAAVKYVFLFIGDGMSVPQRMIADEFSRKSGNGQLVMNTMPYTATTRTCSATSLVTDSAAAATAIACGEKTYNGAVGVDAKGEPIYSCALAAHKAGMKVGIATSVTITHATPAGFYAHRKNRGETAAIAHDLADSGFELFAGGGLSVTNEEPYEYIAKRGYKTVTSKKDFLALKKGCGKVFTRFTNDALGYVIDGDNGLPTLAQIVEKSIELLDNDKGFFLMTEGGSVDWAGHGNDAATNLREVLALDDAVKVAMAFQKKHPNDTLIVVTGDHETGGMSMGFAGTGYALYMDRLANQKMSVGTFGHNVRECLRKNPNATFDDIKPLVTDAFGFKFDGDPKQDPMVLTPEELADIARAFPKDVASACRLVMSHKSGIGWSSGCHTAMPVLTTAAGKKAEMFSGFIENTDISKKLKSLYTAR